MPRVDETEVILSSHIADTEGGVQSDSDRSPLYTDTEVTQNERTVKFWNRAVVSDTSIGKERKFQAKITIDGHGVHTESGWVEHEYTSPLSDTNLTPEKPFSVPDQNLSEYDFDVHTVWELYEKVSGEYSRINFGNPGPIVATVNDNSSS